MENLNDEKIQKVLARAGFGSRREMERWISAGRVKVNGRVAILGDRVDSTDRILVDGKKLAPRGKEQSRCRVLLYNKPEGEICTRHDPEAVGRLDYNTGGLLLFTNDGELANALMHPSSQIDREYAVRVMGEVTPQLVQQMHQGVELDGHLCRFTDVQHYGGEGVNQWYHVVIMEGRNREVRRLWESQGLQISRLKRVRFGPIFIPSNVTRGKFQELSSAEIEKLRKAVGDPKL